MLVDGFLTDAPGTGMFAALSGRMNQLQTDGFIRSMSKKAAGGGLFDFVAEGPIWELRRGFGHEWVGLAFGYSLVVLNLKA